MITPSDLYDLILKICSDKHASNVIPSHATNMEVLNMLPRSGITLDTIKELAAELAKENKITISRTINYDCFIIT